MPPHRQQDRAGDHGRACFELQGREIFADGIDRRAVALEKNACAAPRLRASMPTAPVPAYPSRKMAPPMRICRMSKRVSRRRSGVGLVANRNALQAARSELTSNPRISPPSPVRSGAASGRGCRPRPRRRPSGWGLRDEASGIAPSGLEDIGIAQDVRNYERSGIPDCFVPKNSPGPRSFRSISEM